MDFDEVVKLRKSVRSFKDKTVSWKLVMEAADSACQGPFADGLNHLKFIIVEDQSMIEKIAKLAEQTWINTAPTLVVVCSDDTNLENMHSERGRVYSRQQSGAAIVTFMMKLTDLGLDSCWVGSYSDEMIKKTLGIPVHVQLEAIIPIGYENEKTKKRRKKDLENAIFWEKWSSGSRAPYSVEPKDPGRMEW